MNGKKHDEGYASWLPSFFSGQRHDMKGEGTRSTTDNHVAETQQSVDGARFPENASRVTGADVPPESPLSTTNISSAQISKFNKVLFQGKDVKGDKGQSNSDPLSMMHVEEGSEKHNEIMDSMKGISSDSYNKDSQQQQIHSEQQPNEIVRRPTESAGSKSNHRINLDALRKISWNGIAEEYRAYAWKLLIGYLPVLTSRQEQTIHEKRLEYSKMVQNYFYEHTMKKTALEKDILIQIRKDVPRLHSSALFQNEKVKLSIERLLYIWSIRHPATGYVQGIDSLIMPFFLVFLADELDTPVHEVLEFDKDQVEEVVKDENEDTSNSEEEKLSVLKQVECDTFWCFDSFLLFVQDFYTQDHPGIHKITSNLERVIKKNDSRLYNHIKSLSENDGAIGLEFSQFGFRWVNCLLLREFNLLIVIRLFDTLISEGRDRLAPFLTFFIASMLKKFSKEILQMDYLDLVQFFQDMPTKRWTDVNQLEELLSEAYVLQNLYESDNGT